MSEQVLDCIDAREIFVDGFANHVARDGVMTCVGYRRMTEGKVVVIKLVWPATNTVSAIDDAVEAMNAPALPDKRKRCH